MSEKTVTPVRSLEDSLAHGLQGYRSPRPWSGPPHPSTSRVRAVRRLTTVTAWGRFHRPWGVRLNNPSTDKIRNVAVLGHSGAGKTTLAEALLVRAGVVPRAGRVEDGTTVCDTEPEELKRTM